MELFSQKNGNSEEKGISTPSEIFTNDSSDSQSSTSDSSDSETLDDVYQVEKIVGHKVERGTDYWRVRWVGYSADQDTWEPRANFLDSSSLKLLHDFEAERQMKKERKKDFTRKSLDKTPRKKPSFPDSEGGQQMELEANTSWYGIKADESNHTLRSLFVKDRVLTETEKLLTEYSSPGVRILRNHLKERTKDESVERNELEKEQSPKEKKLKQIEGNEVKVSIDLERDHSPKKKKLKHAEENELKVTNDLERDHSPKKKKIKQGLMSTPTKSKEKKPKQILISPPKPKEQKLPKEKKSKFKTLSPNETGLLLPLCPEGVDVTAAAEYLIQINNENLRIDKTPISEQEFEEIVMDGKSEKVRMVLEEHGSKFHLNNLDEFGKTLIHKLCEIKCGVSHTQCELIDLLASYGARLNIRETSNDQMPIHVAIANRRICHLRKLIELQSPVNAVDKSGKTPLLLALDCIDSEFMKCLLRAGSSFQPALEKLYELRNQNRRQLNTICDHESILRKAFNSARDVIATNMNFKSISPIFVNPIHESKCSHTFKLTSQPQLPHGDNAYLLLACVTEFSQDEQDQELHVETRMWGLSPLQNVIVNGLPCQQFKPGNKFAYFCVPRQGQNQIDIKLDPVMSKSRLMLLTQVVLAQFSRSVKPIISHSISNVCDGKKVN